MLRLVKLLNCRLFSGGVGGHSKTIHRPLLKLISVISAFMIGFWGSCSVGLSIKTDKSLCENFVHLTLEKVFDLLWD